MISRPCCGNKLAGDFFVDPELLPLLFTCPVSEDSLCNYSQQANHLSQPFFSCRCLFLNTEPCHLLLIYFLPCSTEKAASESAVGPSLGLDHLIWYQKAFPSSINRVAKGHPSVRCPVCNTDQFDSLFNGSTTYYLLARVPLAL